MKRLLILLTVILSQSLTAQTVLVTWQPSPARVSGYIVFRRADGDTEFTWMAAVKGLSYIDGEVKPGGVYYYRIRSYDSSTGLESKDSAEIKVRVPKAGQAGQEMVNVNAMKDGSLKITENWKPITIPSAGNRPVDQTGLEIEIRELWRAVAELNRRSQELAEEHNARR